MSSPLDNLITQVETLMGETVVETTLILPCRGSTIQLQTDFDNLIDGVKELERRVIALESGRRIVFAEIVRALKEMRVQ